MIVRQLVCPLFALVSALALLSACASPESARRRDDRGGASGEAEAAPVDTDPRGNARVPDSRQPTQDELAAAFDPDSGAPAKDGAGAGTSQNSSEAHPAEAADPLAPQKAAFEAKEAEVKRAVAAHGDDAPSLAQALGVLAEPLGPQFVTRAWLWRVQAAHGAKDDASAFEFAEKLLLSCGPEKVDGCRALALSWMEKSAAKSANPAKAKKTLSDVREADACAKSAESAARHTGGTLPSCVEEAQRLFRGRKDALMVARLAVAKAHAELGDPKKADKAVRELERAESLCTDARCAEVRRFALGLAVDASLEKGDADSAARAAIRDMQVYASMLPASQRAYAWTDAMDKACAALDAAQGPGSCRKLEQRQAGAFTFRDYSKQNAGEGLGADAVKTVNAHYGVTFQECLSSEAQRLTMPAQERYTVRWVVLNDGRVGEMHMDRKDQDAGPLADCLRKKLTVWRYPRYEGEYQHVEQSFVVSASTRR